MTYTDKIKSAATPGEVVNILDSAAAATKAAGTKAAELGMLRLRATAREQIYKIKIGLGPKGA
jgi:hypothetical protein